MIKFHDLRTVLFPFKVDTNARRLGLTKDIDLGICGDANLAAKEILAAFNSLPSKVNYSN